MTYEAAIADAGCRKLVLGLARRFGRTAADRADLVQEGYIALFDALQTWRADAGTSLSSYAFQHVRGHLADVTARERRRGLTTKHGGQGRVTGVGINDSATLSMDDDSDDGRSLHDVLGNAAPQEAALSDARERAAVGEAVAHLDARDRELLALLDDGLSTAEIAERIDRCTTRVNQLVHEIHERLRLFLSTGAMPTRRYAAKDAGKSIAALAREHGISHHTVRQRLANGWTLETALTTPADPRRTGRPRTKAA